MTAKNEIIEVFCPACHAVQKVETRQLIDLDREPNLQWGILTDSLFSHACTACGARFDVVHETVVVHRDAGYAVLLAPDWKGEAVAAPENLRDLHLRVVRDLAGLKEKVLIFESLMDDRAVELCKIYINLKDPIQEDEKMLFTEHRDGKIVFSIIGPQGETERTAGTSDALYYDLAPRAKQFPEEKGVFTGIDVLWVLDRIEAGL